MQYPEIRVDGEVVERLWCGPQSQSHRAEALAVWEDAYPGRVQITGARNIISLYAKA